MAEIFDISESSELEQYCTEYLIDRRPRNRLDSIYEEAENLALVRTGNVLLDASDIERLCPGRWLNDKIIEAYLGLLCTHFDNIYAFSTHFYTSMWNKPYEVIKEWFSGVNLLSYEYLLIPIYTASHWTLIIVHGDDIEYYDSLGCLDSKAVFHVHSFMTAVRFDSCGSSKPYDISDMEGFIPYQQNSDDCGVFCCMYARYRVDSECEDFFLSDSIGLLRKRILHELLAGEIIYPVWDGS